MSSAYRSMFRDHNDSETGKYFFSTLEIGFDPDDSELHAVADILKPCEIRFFARSLEAFRPIYEALDSRIGGQLPTHGGKPLMARQYTSARVGLLTIRERLTDLLEQLPGIAADLEILNTALWQLGMISRPEGISQAEDALAHVEARHAEEAE